MIVSHRISGSAFLTMRNVSDKSCRENQNTHFVFSNFFSLRKLCRCAVYETMWENTVEPDRLQMTIWRMRIACWIPKAIDTHSEYVIRTAFPLQQKLHECASMLRYTYIAYLAMSVFLLHVFLWILCQARAIQAMHRKLKKQLHINMSCKLLYHAQNHFIYRRKVYSANRVT
jgi:hypothetical protein